MVTKQRSLPTPAQLPLEQMIPEEDNSTTVQRRSRPPPLSQQFDSSWRLSLQDASTTSPNKACVYLQDGGSPRAFQEIMALQRTLSGAQFYKANAALMFLFPETSLTPTQRLGSLVERSSSREDEGPEERRERKWRKRFMGVNKKFVLMHLVSVW